MYHNCMAIACWMKHRTSQPEVSTPAETAQRAEAVSTIAGAWRAMIRKGSEPGVGKRRTAGRVARAAAAMHKNVKRIPKNTRNARKLFLGINIRRALERPQPIGSSWRSEWDFG